MRLTPAEPPFLGAVPLDGAPQEALRALIVGAPYDGATSYRVGARFGPREIRRASDSIEAYCPRSHRAIDGGTVADAGDLDLPPDLPPEAYMEAAHRTVAHIDRRAGTLPWLVLGGDHAAALPFLLRAARKHPNLQVFQIDAHGDLRDSFDGTPYSHACVVRRLLDVLGPRGTVYAWGVRSGPHEEFALAHSLPNYVPLGMNPAAGIAAATRLAARRLPVYVTFDLDGLAPGDLPGTGTPEPGGLPFAAVEEALLRLAGGRCAVVGADLVELAPPLDPSGGSSVTAARAARALLIALGAGLPPR